MKKVALYRLSISLLLLMLVSGIILSLGFILKGFLSEECNANDVFLAAIATIVVLLFTCILPSIYRFFRNGFSKKPAIVRFLQKEAKEIRHEYRFSRLAKETGLTMPA